MAQLNAHGPDGHKEVSAEALMFFQPVAGNPNYRLGGLPLAPQISE
jgi:hypothetical protein